MHARDHSIDIAKGIGIILVIGLHTGFHINWWVNFEMPLFFMLSGIFFSTKRPFNLFIIKKINTLLIPYLFFEIPGCIYNLMFWIYNPNISLFSAFSDSAIPTTTWFLLALFESQILSFLILKYCNKSIGIILIMAALWIGGYLMSRYHITNIASVGSMLSLTPYLLIGNLASRQIRSKSSTTKNLIISIIGLLGCWGLNILDNRANVIYVLNYIPGNPLMAIAMAISGSIGVIFLSKLIKTNAFFEYYGRNSLIILGMHLYIVIAINRLSPSEQHWLSFFITMISTEIGRAHV